MWQRCHRFQKKRNIKSRPWHSRTRSYLDGVPGIGRRIRSLQRATRMMINMAAAMPRTCEFASAITWFMSIARITSTITLYHLAF